MKPQAQGVLTPWNPGFMASGSEADLHDQRKPTGNPVLVVLM
jgi:hypothetical protein